MFWESLQCFLSGHKKTRVFFTWNDSLECCLAKVWIGTGGEKDTLSLWWRPQSGSCPWASLVFHSAEPLRKRSPPSNRCEKKVWSHVVACGCAAFPCSHIHRPGVKEEARPDSTWHCWFTAGTVSYGRLCPHPTVQPQTFKPACVGCVWGASKEKGFWTF